MAKRTLSDSAYIRFKEIGNENSEKGRRYEELLIRWFVLRLASMQARYDIDLSSVTVHHHPPGQFIEDVTLALEQLQAFYHAKSGTTLKWDAKLERDFRSQLDLMPAGGSSSMALYVGSSDKRSEMLATKPADMPPLAVYVLHAEWMTTRKALIPSIRRHLLVLNADNGTASLEAIWTPSGLG